MHVEDYNSFDCNKLMATKVLGVPKFARSLDPDITEWQLFRNSKGFATKKTQYRSALASN